MKTDLMLIPFKISEKSYRLIIVLLDHNLERIKRYDPCVFNMRQLAEFAGLECAGIMVAYCTPEEKEQILLNIATGGKLSETLELLTRGFEYRPDLGDSDNPPTVIRPPGRG